MSSQAKTRAAYGSLEPLQRDKSHDWGGQNLHPPLTTPAGGIRNMITTNETDPDDDLAHRYYQELHKMCPHLRRGRLECDWASSGYCYHCGRPQPTLRDGYPGTMK